MARRFDGDDAAFEDGRAGGLAGGPVEAAITRILSTEPLGVVGGVDGEWDPDRPSPARMYDCFLGGKDYGAADRAAAERENRRFMHRVVAWAAKAGIGQFVDVGTGIPTEPHPHQIAREYQPGAVVVGVDNDPVVLAHDRALLEGMPIVRGDVRDPDALIAGLDELDAGRLDWDRPVAVLLVAVLHFVIDEQDPAGVVRAFAGRLCPGSVVAVSHVSSTGADPAAVAAVEKVYRERATAPGVARTQEQITNLFGRLELVPPGGGAGAALAVCGREADRHSDPGRGRGGA